MWLWALDLISVLFLLVLSDVFLCLFEFFISVLLSQGLDELKARLNQLAVHEKGNYLLEVDLQRIPVDYLSLSYEGCSNVVEGARARVCNKELKAGRCSRCGPSKGHPVAVVRGAVFVADAKKYDGLEREAQKDVPRVRVTFFGDLAEKLTGLKVAEIERLEQKAIAQRDDQKLVLVDAMKSPRRWKLGVQAFAMPNEEGGDHVCALTAFSAEALDSDTVDMSQALKRRRLS